MVTRVVIQKEARRLFADENKIKQSLINLISNAAKYSQGGVIRISSRLENGMIELLVTDDGIGIPQEQQAHMTEKFYQFGQGRVAARCGLGIGLWLVRAYHELHEAELRIESTLGSGSCLTIIFPASRIVLIESDNLTVGDE